MRIVTFIQADSSKKILVDANRIEAVEECNALDTSTSIHAWGGSTFLVKGTMDATLKTLWGEGYPRERGPS